MMENGIVDSVFAEAGPSNSQGASMEVTLPAKRSRPANSGIGKCTVIQKIIHSFNDLSQRLFGLVESNKNFDSHQIFQ